MSVGPGPNLSGGLWMSGIAASPPRFYIGAANTGSQLDCAGSPPGGGTPPGGGPPPSSSGTCNAPSGGQAGSASGSFSVQDWGMQQSNGNGGYEYAQSAGTNPTGSPWAGCGCPPPPGGPNPEAPPNSSAPFSIDAEVLGTPGRFGPINAPISCAETGVTISDPCGGAVFYVDASGTCSFSVPAGSYETCLGGSPQAFDAGSTTGTQGSNVEVLIHTA